MTYFTRYFIIMGFIAISFTSCTINEDEKSFPNASPIAEAGIDQNVTTRTLVTLDGSNSYDPEGNQITYLWEISNKPSESNATIVDATKAISTFVPDVDGYYSIKLTIYNKRGQTTEDHASIRADRVVWERQYSPSSSVSGFVLDGSNNIYTMGFLVDSNTNIRNIVIGKYNEYGEKEWIIQHGTEKGDYPTDITIDSNNNLYIVGWTFGPSVYNNDPYDRDIFISKISSDGIVLWNQYYGTAANDEGLGVAIDSNSNIYITGYTDGNLDGNAKVGSSDVFVTKFTPDGIKLWTQQYGTDTVDRGSAITIDLNDNVFIAGETLGGFNGSTNIGRFDTFLTKLTPDGVVERTTQYGTIDGDYVYDLLIDLNTNIYIMGSTSLIKTIPDGTVEWEYEMENQYETYYSIAIDSNNNVYATGCPRNVPFKTKLHLAYFTSDGTKEWTHEYGINYIDECGYHIEIDLSDNLYILGNKENSTTQYDSVLKKLDYSF